MSIKSFLLEVLKKIETIFLKPSKKIKDVYEYKQAYLTTQLLLFLTIGINSGVIYMTYFSSNPQVGLVLFFSEILFLISYIISRTEYFYYAAILGISILSFIPVFNIIFSHDHSANAILLILIWNALTVIVSCALLPLHLILLFVCLNIISITLLPIIDRDITFNTITLPLIYNIIIPAGILIASMHRSRIEKDRIGEILEINNRLEGELIYKDTIQDRLTYNATHDLLTDLPNRIVLNDRIEHAIHSYKRYPDRNYAVIFIDFDRFKNINDTLGHQYGDLFLVEMSKRLLSSVREQDLVCRFSGDEFVILLEEIEDVAEVMRVINRLTGSIKERVSIEGHNLNSSASFGILIGKEEYVSSDDILRNADIAMYKAKKKKSGSSFEFFDEGMLESVKASLRIESELREAIENDEFIVYYQPILVTETQKVAGFEALIRWNKHDVGLIPPIDFIPIAESSGLIIPIGYKILRKVCEQIKYWAYNDNIEKDFYVSVNISSRQFQDSGFIHKIKSIIDDTEVMTSMLKFELTESLIIDDSLEVNEQLYQIKQLGIEMMIDDFGTGYSSLSYLHLFPIDILKIDKSFIEQLENDDSNIVNAIINLAHTLNLEVVIEGIETLEQYEIIQRMKCDYVQGYFFSKPVNFEKAGKMLN